MTGAAGSRRDVPHEGQRVARGHPVCTVLAEGGGRDDCLRLLEQRANDVYLELTHSRARARSRTRGERTFDLIGKAVR